MLDKANRLKKRKEFGYIYRNGESVYGKYVVACYTFNKFRKIKVGFAVSKKVGKAYMRNLVKRRMRAIVRENMTLMPIATNCVFIAKPNIAEAAWDDLKRDMLSVMSNIGLRKGQDK